MNNNPVFDSLYLKQGWIPVVKETASDTKEAVSLTAGFVPVVGEPESNVEIKTEDTEIENSVEIKSEDAETQKPVSETLHSKPDITADIKSDAVKAAPSSSAASKPAAPKRAYHKHK